ncbi:MAG: ADP-ribosylglycohydrolase family protein [Victivallaceae bacterium]|nr:ADP-ribosylglycohydrolase family protein [Victivallaceae bacterium]
MLKNKEKTIREIKLSYRDYYDKVLAGWLGKSLGGVIGAPFENHKMFGHKTAEQLWPDTLAVNDDLDIQMVWLEAMQERGLYLSSRDLAEFWQDRCYHNYCEYGVFLNNVQRGIAPPLSGSWNNSFFAESEGCPIRSEIWGFVCPGNPRLAAEYAQMDGQLDHGGISVEIEQFFSAMASWALVTNELEEVVKAGLSILSSESRIVGIVNQVRSICEQYPEVYDAWRMIIRRYGDRDASKAITNLAIVLMSLLLGKGDFKKTICICINSGWDTDCTAATAGALLGALKGTPGLPKDWLSKLGSNLICGVAIKHKRAALKDIAQETCQLGAEMAAARNQAVEIPDAPGVTVRGGSEPKLQMKAEYPEAPVLWNRKTTQINLHISNPAKHNKATRLLLKIPNQVQCGKFPTQITLPPGKKQIIGLNVHRKQGAEWLPDRNLFTAKLLSGKREENAELTFGLGGARQWLVYGPYWDMWDQTKNEICPYRNDQVKINPAAMGYRDCYNQYVRFDYQYLDEERLRREDIPDELPFELELGEDLITEKELGGFKGQACYYLVRTIRSPRLTGQAALLVGRSGPCRIWLDGKQLVEYDTMRCWAPDQKVECVLTGSSQRLVVKLIRLSDAMSFSLFFCQRENPIKKAGISLYLDSIEDLPNGI